MARTNWKQVKEVFHEALRHTSSERDIFLDRACGGDLDLRIEVESLLIALNDAKSFLERPLVSRSSEPQSSWQLQNGEAISHYKIVEPIGAGGMGEVYLAEDNKLQRKVALKVLPSSMVKDIGRLRRFEREAMAVSALNHPNILTIFDFDTVDGIHLFASEFIDGETLRERITLGRLSIAEALDVSVQIASALQAAHNAGVVHRDIKPENIMVRNDGYVKVLDFGLAKLTGEISSGLGPQVGRKSFSSPGVILGTATYMSPEQARSRSIDARTDIFSFGVVLYEMLAGNPPFRGDTASDVIASIIQNDPERLSTANEDVPPELDRIVAKMLEKDRAQRYQAASDLLSDLRGAQRLIEAAWEKPGRGNSPQEPYEAWEDGTNDRAAATMPPAVSLPLVKILIAIFVATAIVAAFAFFWLSR